MKFALVILASIYCLPHLAWAASAYIVDDADIVDKDTLQNENWISHSNKGETLAVANAAYQILPRTEFTLQAERDIVHDEHTDTLSPEVKYMWHKGEEGDLEASFVLGGVFRADGGRMTEFYSYIPLSVAVNKALDVNVNLGIDASRGNNSSYAGSWGLGTELHADEALSFVSEVFGHDTDTPGFQLGPRYILNKMFTFDLVYGHNVFDDHADLATAGLTVNF